MKSVFSNKGGAFVTSLITSLIISLIMCVVFDYFGPGVLGKLFVQTIDVPNIVGMGAEEAKAALIIKKLVLSVQGETNDPKLSKGSVVSQNPSAGLKVKKASSISAILGSGKMEVPKLTLLPLAEAKGKITECGLTVGEIMEEDSDQAPAGAVVSSDPIGSDVVPLGTPVSLVVSKGVGSVMVPKLIGKAISAAKKSLAAAGLSIGNIKETTSEYHGFNIIIDQDPKAGAQAPKGSGVDVTLNVEGKEE